MPGISNLRFVDPDAIDRTLRCPTCYMVVKDAVETPCKHVFCRECIKDCLSVEKSCPLCRFPDISYGQLVQAIEKTEQVGALTVRCDHSKFGCRWKGQLKQAEIHETTCGYRRVSCPDCAALMSALDLKGHLPSCRGGLRLCTFCNTAFATHDLLEKHINFECAAASTSITDCPNSCGAQIQRRDLTKHTERECILTPLDCQFMEHGCTAKFLRSNAKQHYETNLQEHLVHMSTKLKVQDQEIKDLHAAVKQRSDEIQQLVHMSETEKRIRTESFVRVEKTLADFVQSMADHKAKTAEVCNAATVMMATRVNNLAATLEDSLDDRKMWEVRHNDVLSKLNQSLSAVEQELRAPNRNQTTVESKPRQRAGEEEGNDVAADLAAFSKASGLKLGQSLPSLSSSEPIANGRRSGQARPALQASRNAVPPSHAAVPHHRKCALLTDEERECVPTFVVDQREGPFHSIADAMREAEAGSLIQIYPGHYEESIRMEWPLHIEGVGSKDQIVIETKDRDSVTFECAYGSLSNMTIRQCGSGYWSCMDLSSGDLYVENCTLFSASLSCISVHHKANPVIRHCRINGCKGNGVLVYHEGKGTYEDNDIYNNSLSGFEVTEAGNPQVRFNRISSNRQNGVLCYDNGKGVFEDNEIYGNHLAGVEVRDGGNPYFMRNRIMKQSLSAGVYIYQHGRGVFSKNEVSHNAKSGFSVWKSGKPHLKQNRVFQNGEYGVYVHDGGWGIYEENDLRDNGKDSFYADEDSEKKIDRERNMV